MQSNGGLSDVELARRQCVQMMESGPAGGVVGTMALCELLDLEAAIAFDMGGTTAKASVIRRGEPSLSPDYFIGGYNEGLAIRIPVLDIVEVGTGGGSIAWLDEGGGLHVGPKSAGAEPGPASYGRGGTEPTVTDANVILGRLSPERFLGGEMRLDRNAAETALRERLGQPLGVSLERAASGMLQVATSAMANAVRHVTLERGLDPRDFTLVAYGGGGPLHAASVAKELSIGTIIIPHAPGHFSALGMLMADLRRDYVQTLFERMDDLEMFELEDQFKNLEAEGRRALEKSGIPTDRIVFERAADMRYVGQEHAVAVRMPANVGDEDARGGDKAAVRPGSRPALQPQRARGVCRHCKLACIGYRAPGKAAVPKDSSGRHNSSGGGPSRHALCDLRRSRSTGGGGVRPHEAAARQCDQRACHYRRGCVNHRGRARRHGDGQRLRTFNHAARRCSVTNLTTGTFGTA